MSRLPKRLERTTLVVLICDGKDCRAHGSRAIRKALKQRLKDHGLKRSALLLKTKCTGNCKHAPICGFAPSNQWLSETTPQEACKLLDHLVGEEPPTKP